MTKISNKVAYKIKSPIIGSDYFPITNSVNQGVGMAKGATKSADFDGVRAFVIAGLNPELGGVLKFTEIEYNGVLTSPASVANAIDPDYVVSQYEILFFNINGNKYILKLQDVTIGDTSPNISDSDFIKILAFTQLGDGTPILKGYDVATGNHEFYAIKSTGLDISIVTGNVVIEKKAGSNLGSGIPIYKGLNSTTKIDEFYNLKPLGLSITKETVSSVETGNILVEQIDQTNLGDGVAIYKALNNTTKLQEFYKLKSLSLDITKEIISGNETGNVTIELKVPTDNKTFFVNVNSTSPVENGTISNPYKSFKKAYDAYKGTGTIINPEFSGVGTIELLSSVEIPSSGADSMGYLSINQLKIKGNNFTIVYSGSQNYFISTEYLVGLDPKTTNDKLDNTIFMSFKDVVIESRTVHGIINNLNYTSPSTSVNQNTSGILFENCTISDLSFLVELGSYTDTTVDLFGTPVYAQNSLSATQYMIKNKDVIWNGEGNFIMKNCILNGSSSTILYNLNSSLSWTDITINFNPYYVNYKDKTGSVYNPADNTYYFLSENNGLSGRTSNFLRIENFKQTIQVGSSGNSPIGGQNCLYRGIGDSLITIYNGSFYSEKLNNLLQLHNTNSFANFTNVNCLNLSIADSTYGAFKYTGSLPVSPIVVDVTMSTINNVKDWTTLQYITPTASSAIINGAYFTDKVTYANNSDAKTIGNLVPGNVYYNTSTNIATRVV